MLKLPVTEILPALDSALNTQGKAVLVAPPGAGKTTLVPLHLIRQNWCQSKKIILLEPRRLAARAAARQIATLIGEKLGETVGYRMRLDSKVSKNTRIIVVTEGVFSRMILDDPELSSVAAVLFDEFHERSLDADFGLALTLDVMAGLRPDLRLVVMSATLDGARITKVLQSAPLIETHGRAFPVEIVYQPRKINERLEDSMASAIRYWLSSQQGSILAFLPGQKEIKRTADLLHDKLDKNVVLAPLYGAMDSKDQDIAIKPAEAGKRKVVLATSIAESSLTIDGVNIVIDSGLARVPVFEPATGVTRLETVKASRASVDQRSGRAGRTASGIAVRLWQEGQTSSLPDYQTPEILVADLSNLVLDSAAFGITDINQLTFLDAPPKPQLNEAVYLLQKLGALDQNGRITDIGEQMRQKALPVRLAAMLIKAKNAQEAKLAAEIAVILTERGLGGNDEDIERRIENFRRDKSDKANKARILVNRLATSSKLANDTVTSTPHVLSPAGNVGRLMLSAWPDRVAKSRGQGGRFLLANGRGVVVDEFSLFGKSDYLVVGDLMGKAEQARVLAAAKIDEETIRSVLNEQIQTSIALDFDPQSQNFRAKKLEKLGAICLSEKPLPLPRGEEADRAMIGAIKRYGLDLLPWSAKTLSLRKRLDWLYRALGDPWPAMSNEALAKRLDEWLLPFLKGEARLETITDEAIHDGLLSLVPYALQKEIDKKAPSHFTVPTGSEIAINYEGEAPLLSVRVQELFGLNEHPAIADGKIPLVVELLSPARRPIQVTGNLPGFWRGSWADTRADMRGRYPKHYWPEDPLAALPTRRAKPRNG
ncbi:ATP-dependent helicase HrpB [uncultured Bartonella sp.]|uniref:ATP-dependent helicase HrpB n=1 Tax=uncultured Bartonella sp. TaxID=104108 RepID=UPI00260986DC|nr:ATP-dependent helicase HrpB [uncultured Bartonella sp.]